MAYGERDLLKGGEESLPQRSQRRFVRFQTENQELITFRARHKLGALEVVPQKSGQLEQHLVAGLPSLALVKFRKAVDVQGYDRKLGIVVEPVIEPALIR